MITGFRVARGGAQELYGVEPDLTVMGKIIGGGLPAAAFAGPREAMERIAPAGDVYQAGTLSGNPLAAAAGLATLAWLDADAYERLGVLTDRLAAGFAALAAERPLQVASAPGLTTLFFSAEPVHDFAAATACDTEAHARFCRAMLDRGVYPPPAQFEAWFVSLAHRRGDDRPHPGSRRRVARRGAGVSRAAPRPEEALRTLAAQLREEDTPISPHVVDPAAAPRLGVLAAAGPRAPRAPGEYSLVVEAVREGYLLHYGEPRLLAGHDADLGLLAGDYLYALGLDRLAALGDTAAVAVLSDLISRCAQLHAEGRGAEVADLWTAAAREIAG